MKISLYVSFERGGAFAFIDVGDVAWIPYDASREIKKEGQLPWMINKVILDSAEGQLECISSQNIRHVGRGLHRTDYDFMLRTG